ncbi:hypothetical protein M0811_02664 [Anaeramoeba ignava]|uniref:Uncharacterized protein n=1 Tax=Anaeramoeba ignava TaxID=1746090 RepID=A0A9Q0L961_ANAIG|nr:hypothetical protein M0811_02664 [Anaeramoeba ignava]
MKKILFLGFFFLFVQSEINSIKSLDLLPNGMQNTYNSLIDSESGFVYFVDCDFFYGFNSHLFKFRMSDLELVDYIDLGVTKVYCGIIDVGNKLAYFGTNNNPSQIIKVNLTTFEVIDIIVLDTISGLYSAQIDTINQKAYFITKTSSASVLKLDLVNFSIESNLSLSQTGGQGSVIDVPNQFLYVLIHKTSSRIHKIDLSNFTEVDSIALAEGESYPLFGVIDFINEFMYVGAGAGIGTDTIKVIKVDLKNFTEVTSIDCESYEINIYGAGIDEDRGIAYFLAWSGYLVRINLTDFTRIDSLEFHINGYSYTMVMDSSSNYSFIGFDTSRAIKVDLTTFTQENSTHIPNYQFPKVILIDEVNQIGYVGFNIYFGFIAKIDLRSFEIIDFLAVSNYSDRIYCGEIDVKNGFAYFFVHGGLKIIKVQLSNFSIIEEKKFLDNSNSYTVSSSFDEENHFLYVSFEDFDQMIYSILKISLPDLEIVDNITNPEVKAFLRLFIDSSKGYLYSHFRNSSDNHYYINKIDLSSFSEVDYVDLVDEYTGTMVLDKKYQYIYFTNETHYTSYSDSNPEKLGTGNDWSSIFRVSLTNMEIIDSKEVSGIESFSTSFLDSSGDYGFFLSNFYNNEGGYYEARVIQIGLNPIEILENISIGNYTNILVSGVDYSTGYGYFATSKNDPNQFIQIFGKPNPVSSSNKIFPTSLIIEIISIIFLIFGTF